MIPKLPKFLTYVEILLLIIPVIGFIVFNNYFSNDTININFNNGYFTVTLVEGTIIWLLLLSFPFLLHLFLRLRNKRVPIISRAHVWITVAIILIFPFIYSATPLISERWNNNLLPPPPFDTWVNNMKLIILLWIIFIVTQIVYYVHAFTKLKK